MKTAIMILALGAATQFAFAQTPATTAPTVKPTTKEMPKVPQAAKDAFAKAYPEAKAVNWDQEGNNYEVEFKDGEMKMGAEYDADGKLLETEKPIAEKELPAGVMDYVFKTYKDDDKDMKPKEISKITATDGTVTYEVRMRNKDLVFDKSGKFIEKSKE